MNIHKTNGEEISISIENIDYINYSDNQISNSPTYNHGIIGNWETHDREIKINGSTGKFTFIKSNSSWENINSISIGSVKIKDIKPSGYLKWTGKSLWYKEQETRWSATGTITLSEDGSKLTISTINPFDGRTTSTRNYTRK